VAYVASLYMRSTFGQETATQEDEAHLDARFARVRGRSVEKRGEQVLKEETVRREGAEWVYEQPSDPAGKPKRGPAATGDHGSLASMILLARTLHAAPAGVYRLSRVDFKAALRARALVVTLGPGTTTRDHRGQKVEVREVRMDVEGDDSITFFVTADRRVVAITIQGAPITMVLGTADEVLADLPAVDAPKPKGVADTPLAAVKVYLDVLARVRKVEELDGVMDWAAIRDDLAREQDDPTVAALPPDAMAELLKAQTREAPAVDPAEVEALVPLLVVKEEGDSAEVAMPPPAQGAFLLRRVDGVWWIVHFPH
jgi:hypothetical protein